jgi:hypothetical protein
VRTTSSRPKLVVSSDGCGVVATRAPGCSRLLADLADATCLTGAFSTAPHRLRPRGTGHDPGRVAVDLAVTLANTRYASGGLSRSSGVVSR